MSFGQSDGDSFEDWRSSVVRVLALPQSHATKPDQ
jgi:hypothetical protein